MSHQPSLSEIIVLVMRNVESAKLGRKSLEEALADLDSYLDSIDRCNQVGAARDLREHIQRRREVVRKAWNSGDDVSAIATLEELADHVADFADRVRGLNSQLGLAV